MASGDFSALQQRLQEFADERAWDQFHSPKNLSIALLVEAAELVEHFQWMSEDESRRLSASKKEAVAEELADIAIYLVRLATKLAVHLDDAIERKVLINAQKYPVEKSTGNPTKYTDLD